MIKARTTRLVTLMAVASLTSVSYAQGAYSGFDAGLEPSTANLAGEWVCYDGWEGEIEDPEPSADEVRNPDGTGYNQSRYRWRDGEGRTYAVRYNFRWTVEGEYLVYSNAYKEHVDYRDAQTNAPSEDGPPDYVRAQLKQSNARLRHETQTYRVDYVDAQQYYGLDSVCKRENRAAIS